MCLQIFNADSADNKVAEVLRQHFWFEVYSSCGAYFPVTRLPLISFSPSPTVLSGAAQR